jgi:hypothetical protein
MMIASEASTVCFVDTDSDESLWESSTIRVLRHGERRIRTLRHTSRRHQQSR